MIYKYDLKSIAISIKTFLINTVKTAMLVCFELSFSKNSLSFISMIRPCYHYFPHSLRLLHKMLARKNKKMNYKQPTDTKINRHAKYGR
jgi:hypothetical protein